MLDLNSDIVTWGTMVLLGIMIIFTYLIHGKIYRVINRRYRQLCEQEPGYLPSDVEEKIVRYMEHNKQKFIQTQTLVEEYISEWGLKEGRRKSSKRQSLHLVTLLRLLKSFPSKMIIIGVLGTFIGLVISLSEIAQIAQAADNIMGVVAGMNIAFYTSIAGIISSLITQSIFMWRNTDSILNLYMLKLELHINMCLEDYKTDVHMEKLDEINSNIKEVAEGLGAIRELDAIAKQLNKFNIEFKTNITQLTKSLEGSISRMSRFSKQIIELGGKFDGLINAFESHNEANQSIIQCMQGTYSSIQETLQSQKLVNEGLKATFEENAIFNRERDEQFNALNAKVLSNIEELITKSNNVFAYLIKEYQEAMNTLHQKLTMGFDNQFEQVRQGQQEITNLVTYQMEAMLDKHRDHTAQIFQSNTDQMKILQQGYNEISEKFDSNGDILITLTTNYGNLEKEQQHLIQETQKMVAIMQVYAQQIEGTLRDDIRKTIREMQEHTKIMNQTIMKKFQDIDYDHLTSKFIETYESIQKNIV